jgi:hypothetical protein
LGGCTHISEDCATGNRTTHLRADEIGWVHAHLRGLRYWEQDYTLESRRDWVGARTSQRIALLGTGRPILSRGTCGICARKCRRGQVVRESVCVYGRGGEEGNGREGSVRLWVEARVLMRVRRRLQTDTGSDRHHPWCGYHPVRCTYRKGVSARKVCMHGRVRPAIYHFAR